MKKILYVLLLLSLSSCEIELEDMYLTRSDYDSDILRIDGYYYTKEPESNRVALRYFFYRNGVCYDNSSPYFDSFIELEEYLKSLKNAHQKYALGWGIFHITDSTILTEEYFRSSLEKKLTAIFSGRILNDTTFTLLERYKLDGNGDQYNTHKFNLTFHFRQYSTKRDSVNIYIK